MKHNNLHPLVKEYLDLEEFGEALFAITPSAPKLSRKNKKVILKTIIKPQKSTHGLKLGFGFAATAFAAFAIMFGFAQTTNPGDTLYTLNVGGSAVQKPTIEQTETIKAELQKQQITVETLKRTKAPVTEIKKAEKNLNKTIKSGRRYGIDVTKILEDVKRTDSNRFDSKEQTDAGVEHSEIRIWDRSGSGSSTSTNTNTTTH